MDERRREPLDPTKVRDQPSLRSSSGRVWIVTGGLFLCVILVVLAWIVVGGGTAVPVAITTAALAVALYVVLLVARLVARPGKVRLRIMAAAMIGMALFSIAGLLASVWVEAMSTQ